MGALRFTASQWRAVNRAVDGCKTLFALAMVHLKNTEARPIQKASGRSKFGCWVCEQVIERGENYRATLSDRRDKLVAHESCLKRIRRWADAQEKRYKTCLETQEKQSN